MMNVTFRRYVGVIVSLRPGLGVVDARARVYQGLEIIKRFKKCELLRTRPLLISPPGPFSHSNALARFTDLTRDIPVGVCLLFECIEF